MKLHLITIAYNQEWLEEIYKSIPKVSNIEWHIIFQSKEIFNQYWRNPTNISKHIYSEELPNTEKLNMLLNHLYISKGEDNYFYILDNDTVMLPNLYKIYHKLKHFQGLIIGNQDYFDGKRRLDSDYPKECQIDSGSCLIYGECLEKCKWEKDEKLVPDFKFMKQCFEYYGKDRTILLNETISVHNALRLEVGDKLN